MDNGSRTIAPRKIAPNPETNPKVKCINNLSKINYALDEVVNKSSHI